MLWFDEKSISNGNQSTWSLPKQRNLYYSRTINIRAQMALERGGEDLAKKKLNRFISSLPTTPKKIQSPPTQHPSMLVLIIDHLLSNCCGCLSGWFLFFFFCQQDHVSTMAINSLWFHSWHLWLLTKVSRQLTRQKRAKYILY